MSTSHWTGGLQTLEGDTWTWNIDAKLFKHGWEILSIAVHRNYMKANRTLFPGFMIFLIDVCNTLLPKKIHELPYREWDYRVNRTYTLGIESPIIIIPRIKCPSITHRRWTAIYVMVVMGWPHQSGHNLPPYHGRGYTHGAGDIYIGTATLGIGGLVISTDLELLLPLLDTNARIHAEPRTTGMSEVKMLP